jgi:hypothetical protein
MLVSTAIAGTAVPAFAAEPDPIFAAIEARKAASAATRAAVGCSSGFEDELQANGRLRDHDRLPDERRRAAEIEAAIDLAHDARAGCGLRSAKCPAEHTDGRDCLVGHAPDYDDAIYGMGWPTDLVDADWRAGHAGYCVKDTRSWQYFLIAGLIEDLPRLVPTAA